MHSREQSTELSNGALIVDSRPPRIVRGAGSPGEQRGMMPLPGHLDRRQQRAATIANGTHDGHALRRQMREQLELEAKVFLGRAEVFVLPVHA